MNFPFMGIRENQDVVIGVSPLYFKSIFITIPIKERIKK